MKTYPERVSELNELGYMVHIFFGVISQSDYTTGNPSLDFWFYVGMEILTLVKYSLEENNLMFLGGEYTLSIPV